MKAIVNQDIIVRVTASGPVEIGKLPKGVGLERLRFDGEKVLDLADLTAIHVCQANGIFELHAVPVKGSQPIEMTYNDRKHLISEDGVIRVLTAAERQARATESKKMELKARLRTSLKKDLGDSDDQLASLSKLLFMVVDNLVNKTAESQTALAEIALTIKDIYPAATTTTELKKMGQVLKEKLPTYYQEKQR